MNFPPGKILLKLPFIVPALAGLLIIVFSAQARAIVYAYAIALSTKYDHKKTIEDEKNVILELKDILQNYNDYSMRAFNRTAISHKVPKTPETTHSFYVIYKADGTFKTLNYSATGKLATSRGAWAINTNGDISSYLEFLRGNNRWNVEEYKTNNGINTRATITNVLLKAESKKIKYFFRAKPNKSDKYDNCNTGILETLVEN